MLNVLGHVTVVFLFFLLVGKEGCYMSLTQLMFYGKIKRL